MQCVPQGCAGHPRWPSIRCPDQGCSWYAPTERGINLIAPRLFLLPLGWPTATRAPARRYSTRITAWRKQSGGQSGSFQNLVLEGHAFWIVFPEPGFRGVRGGEDLMCSGSSAYLLVLT